MHCAGRICFMKIVIIGTGFVAQAYLRCLHYLGYHPLVLSRSWLDYTDPEVLEFTLKSYQPVVVINCAGFTGETVDDCQNNPEECFRANMDLPGMIAKVCNGLGCWFIHISSGCIFNCMEATENDEPNFISNVYQSSKLYGENLVRNRYESAFVFRIRMPFSHIPHPRNWLTKLMKYDQILDGLNSVTWIDEFAMRSWQLWQKAPPGIYHATQRNPVRTMEVARMLRPDVAEYDPVEFRKLHIQRSSAVLDCSKFEKSYGTEFTDSWVALRWCIDQMKTSDGNAQRCPEGRCKTGSPSSVQIALRQMSQNIADHGLAGRAQIESAIPQPRKDGIAS